MKTITVIIICLILSNFSYCQEKKEKQTTEAEQFSAQAGTLIEKQFIDIGKVRGISIQVMKLKDLNNGSIKTALRFEFDYKSSYSTETKISTIDLDEMDGLIKSMNNLKTNIFQSTRDVYTEVTFKSRTGFEAGAYYDINKKKWTSYIQIEKFDKNSLVFFDTEDFSNLLSLIEQAKTKM